LFKDDIVVNNVSYQTADFSRKTRQIFVFSPACATNMASVPAYRNPKPYFKRIRQVSLTVINHFAGWAPRVDVSEAGIGSAVFAGLRILEGLRPVISSQR